MAFSAELKLRHLTANEQKMTFNNPSVRAAQQIIRDMHGLKGM